MDKLLPGWGVSQLAALFPQVPLADLQPVPDLVRPARPPQPAPDATSEPLFGGLSAFTQLITWRGVELPVPYRVYFFEPPVAQGQGLTSRQRQLVYCVYLRHYDGFVRQRHLEALLKSQQHSPADFAVPFLFSLLGEYVSEILAVLAQHLPPGLLRS
ncbi:MAG: hypothetical protein EOO59_13990 [Hymenobacter sp.]|nr:MAG: hypothetical protein EOO59_13990 [Hymenobacter sp.]